jgi:hypothetical protein
MWLMPMMGYTSNRIPNHFHGFIPNRGTATAWKSILNSVVGFTNIYEIDFRSFFPSVKTDMLGYFMNSVWHLPPQAAFFFYQMNNSLPNFDDPLNMIPTEVKWSASHQDVFASDMAIRNMYRTWGDKIVKIRLLDKSYDSVNQFQAPNLRLLNNKPIVGETNRAGLSRLSISAGSDDIAAIIESQTVTPRSNPLEQQFREEYDIRFRGGTGLPQGSPLSPYLSILYLNEVLHLTGMPADVKCLFYADDGLFYSNSYESLSGWLERAFFSGPSSPESFGYYNIHLATDKSGWIRKEGEWLKPLKFLGLVYTAATKTSVASLIAKTRSGKSQLQFSLTELVRWSHSSSLIGEVRASTIRGRLDLFRGFKSTPTTRAMIFYYESLLLLHSFSIPFASLENLYLWNAVSRQGAARLIMFIVSGAYRLDSRESLDLYLRAISEGYEVLPLERVDLIHLERFLNAGYYEGDNQEYLRGPTQHLLTDLQVRGHVLDSPSPVSILFAKNSIFASLLSAAHFFGFDWTSSRYSIPVTAFAFKFQKFLRRLWYPLNLLVFNRYGIPLGFTVGQYDNKDQIGGVENPISPISRYMYRHNFRNLANSRFFGLIMSRLYLGSYNLPASEAQTHYHAVPDSVGGHLWRVAQQQSLPPTVLNIYTGSSYGFHEIVRLASHNKRQSRSKIPFHLFREGFLPSNSWSDVSQLRNDA